jgi:hypothetical protein
MSWIPWKLTWPASPAYSSKHLVFILAINEIPARAFVRRLAKIGR